MNKVFFLILSCIFPYVSGHGATYTWQLGTSDLPTSTNWNPLGPPTSSDAAVFFNVGSATPTLNSLSPVASFQANTIFFPLTTQGYTLTLNRSGGNIQIVGGGIDASNSPFAQFVSVNQGTFIVRGGASCDIGNSGLVTISTTTTPAATAFINITDFGTKAGKANFFSNTSPGFSQATVQFTSGADAENANIAVNANGNASNARCIFSSAGTTANHATINSINKGLVSFSNGANADWANITLNNSTLNFTNANTTAGHATIVASNNSIVGFSNSTPSAGTATISLDHSSITFSNSSSGGNATINLTSSTLTFNQSNQVGSINSDATSTVTSNNSLIIGGNDADSDIEGSYNAPVVLGSLTKVGVGTLTLNGTNNYRGGTSINVGTVKAGADSNLGSTSPISNITIGTTGTLEISNTFATSRQITVNLGSQINVNPAKVFTVNTAIVGSGGSVTKINDGTLTLTAANTYTGGTNISAGILALTGSGSLASTGNVTLTSNGSLDISGIAASQTIADLSGSSGTTIVLGAKNLTLGTGTPTTTFSGNMSGVGGNLRKEGSGAVVLSGTNTYSGTTIVNNGILQGTTSSLPGPIDNNATLIFDQSFSGTYASQISGGGAVIKKGSGNLFLTNTNTIGGLFSIEEGVVSVNNILQGLGDVFVASSGTLQGLGPINKNVTIQGILNAGNSIGTMTINGNLTFDSGASFYNEITPTTTDLLFVTGIITINPGVSISIKPSSEIYNFPKTYLISSGAAVIGTFDSILVTLPLLTASLQYLPTQIKLYIFPIQFAQLFNSGNLGAVSHCLDNLPHSEGSDLSNVINSVQLMNSLAEVEQALNQLQPSLFTSLAITQENDMLYVRNILEQGMEDYHCRCKNNKKKSFAFWTTPFIAKTLQKNHGLEPGFHARSEGFFSGIGNVPSPLISLGGGIGYLHNHLYWHQERGNSSANTMYAAFLIQCENERFYLHSGVIEGLNYYKTDRHIQFGQAPIINRHARGSHHGWNNEAYLQLGVKANPKSVLISPFVSFDYLYLSESSFVEHGADSLNLKVFAKHSNLLVSQGGMNIGHSHFWKTFCLFPYIQLSILRESRFKGKEEKAKFSEICPMTLSGYYPSRTLGALSLGIKESFALGEISFSYQGKYGSKYHDNAFYLKLLFSW
jgi:fibronectin-binding autotransporter adhesin